MSNDSKGPAPEIVLNDGALRAASWREEGEYGPFYNTKITRRYTNADGEVRETSTLRERDLLPAAELAAEIRREIISRKREHSQSQDQSQGRAQESPGSEDWHDDTMRRDEIKRERFKEDRQSRGQRPSRPRGPAQD